MAGAGFALRGPGRSIRLDGADAMMSHLRRLAPDWPPASAADAGARVTVTTDGLGHVRIASSVYEAPAYAFAAGFEAANGILGALIGSYAALDSRLSLLHCGAVRAGGDLLVLLGDNFAGKSTLSVALAAAGAELYADDRLVVVDGPDGFRGRALGIRPKLRLPLPAEAGEDFRRFVAARSVPATADVTLVDRRPGEQVGFGEEAPLGRLLVLDRQPGHEGPPALAPVGRAEATRLLLDGGFAPHLDGQARLDRTIRLAGATGPRRIVYRDSFACAAWLAGGGLDR